MTLSVGTLIEFSTAALESVLDQMRNRLDGLQDRIADLENEGSSEVLSESDVEDIAERVIRNSDLADSDHNHDFYDQISDQVYDMVKDVVREDLDEKDFADRDHDHDGSYASVDEHNDLSEQVNDLDNRLGAIEQYGERIEALEARDGHNHANDHDVVQALVARIDALEQAAQRLDTEALDTQHRLLEMQESSSASTRFFKLAVQMLDIVRESVGR